MGKKEKEILINSFVCPLVWNYSKKSRRKSEKIQERCLRIIVDDYENNYDALLHKSGKSTMEVKRLRILKIEILKH